MSNLEIESIQYGVVQSSSWRGGIAKRYPADPRNSRAAELLDALARENPSEVSAETLAAFEPYWGTPALREAVNETSRAVGFRARPANLDEFLQLALAHLTAGAR
jgi:hypothetical protein